MPELLRQGASVMKLQDHHGECLEESENPRVFG